MLKIWLVLADTLLQNARRVRACECCTFLYIDGSIGVCIHECVCVLTWCSIKLPVHALCVCFFVCVCWSWQLPIVLLISGQQFLADEDKTVTNPPLPLFLPLPPQKSLVLFFFFLILSWSSSPLHPCCHSVSSLTSCPARPLRACFLFPPVIPFFFAPSSTRLPSPLRSCFVLSRLVFCVVICSSCFSLRVAFDICPSAFWPFVLLFFLIVSVCLLLRLFISASILYPV